MIVERPAHGHHVVSIGRKERRVGTRGLEERLHVGRLIQARWVGCLLHGFRHQDRRRSWHCLRFIISSMAFFILILLLLVLLLELLLLLEFGLPLGGHHGWIHVAHQGYALLVHRHTARAPDQHVLRLQVRVDNPTDPMQVVQANKSVGRDFADDVQRNAFKVVPLDQSQHVGAHGLENHANVFSIHSKMLEVVYQLHHAREGKLWEKRPGWPLLCLLPRFVFASLRSLCQKLNLIICSLCVVGSALLHLHCHISGLCEVLTEPHRGKVSPSQFGKDVVASIVDLTNVYGVISTFAVSISALIITLRVILSICRVHLVFHHTC
mmetsp:Transcript_1111/g.2099  ORF Transcript_1111/g.2099 Transcript_1111/m.2099 type:complete len:323 (-) Transcript_1111:64-1032(-)